MTETQVWLARGAYERLMTELAALLRQRAEGRAPSPTDGYTRDSTDPAGDQQFAHDRRELEHRIRKLQKLLQDPVVGQDPADDGLAEPGMVLTVRYEDDQETETFLLAHNDDGAYPEGLMICSPDSPLGGVLPGAKQGDRVRYRLPNGHTTEITLLSAVPYRTEPDTPIV